ncbi:YdhK family protein [Niallia oryzisoli]|uniref:YdhK family protein n=1 Tax=Niallia oryzisoli TaxID=1737571 RepID=UPI003736812F
MKLAHRNAILFTLLASVLLFLGACSNANEDAQQMNDEKNDQEAVTKETKDTSNEDMDEMDHAGMDHSGSSEVPEGLKAAENPTYPVGSKAIIQSDHMQGMMGAEATITGAYDTTVYTVSYTPTTGGERVENHKWIIHEELIDPGQAPLKPGAEAKTASAHLDGMADTTLTIDSAEQTTVYMVDYTTPDGKKVTNHKWVTESELAPA